MNTTTQTTAGPNIAPFVKVAAGEYVREDGVKIVKSTRVRAWWIIELPNGEWPQMPDFTGGWREVLPAQNHSLAWAKDHAAWITPESPVYRRRAA